MKQFYVKYIGNHANVLLILSILATLLCYLSAVNFPFIYDDLQSIIFNQGIHAFPDLKKVIFSDLRQIRVWQNLSFSWDWFIAAEPWPFRVTNLIMHLMNAYLLHLFLKKLQYDHNKSRLILILFLVAPIQIQSVHYIMGRITLLQSFFYLLLANLYLSSQKSIVKIYIALILSLLAKETVLLIPLMFWLMDWSEGQNALRKKWKEYALYSSIIPLYYLLYLVLKDSKTMYGGVTGFDLYPFFRYFWTQFYYLCFYVELIFNPAEQAILHAFPQFTFNIKILGGIGLIAFALCLWQVRKRKNKVFNFLFFLLLVPLLPTNSILQMMNPFAEYRMYLVGPFVFYLLIEIFWWLAGKLKRAQLGMILFTLFLTYQSMFTYLNLQVFSVLGKPYTFALELYKESAQLNYLYGEYLLNNGHKEGIDYCKRGYQYYLNDPYPSRLIYPYILGKAYFSVKQYAESVAVLESYTDFKPYEVVDQVKYYELLSRAYERLGNKEKFQEYQDKKAHLLKN